MNQELAHQYRDKIVAVTGCNGYLGAALAARLRPIAAQVIPVSRPHADVRTLECWSDIVSRAEIIFHLAGNTSVGDAARDPEGSLRSSVLPLIHLATAARQAQRRPRVVFASTATVYGLTDHLPVDEDAEARPITTYDLHKLCAEQHLAFATHQGLLESVSLRLANVYGPSPGVNAAAERGILNKVTRLAVDGADLHLYGGGEFLRDYVYIDDVVRAFVMAGVRPVMGAGTFNVASGTGTTGRDVFGLVVERAARVSGRRSVIRDTAWPDQTDPIERRHFTANIDRIATACGWKPAVSLPDGIDGLIEHLVAVRIRA